jgi:hypothetical protein
MHLLTVFANNILPVLLLAGAGFSLGKIFHLDPRTLGRVIFYVFSPLLVFDLITRSRLSFGEIGLMIGCAASIMLGSLALAFLLGKLLRLECPTLMAVLLTSLVGNNGNYGLPLSHLPLERKRWPMPAFTLSLSEKRV